MTDSAEIPKDVIKTARDVVSWHLEPAPYQIVADIAHAIMAATEAERERCAKTAAMFVIQKIHDMETFSAAEVAAAIRLSTPDPAVNAGTASGSISICRSAARHMVDKKMQWHIDPQHILNVCDAAEAVNVGAVKALAWRGPDGRISDEGIISYWVGSGSKERLYRSNGFESGERVEGGE